MFLYDRVDAKVVYYIYMKRQPEYSNVRSRLPREFPPRPRQGNRI